MPSTDRKLELTAKASMAQPVSQSAVCSNGLKRNVPGYRLSSFALLAAHFRTLDARAALSSSHPRHLHASGKPLS